MIPKGKRIDENKEPWSLSTRNLLLGVTIGACIIMAGVTGFGDVYDNQIYYTAAQNVFHGLLPWNGNTIFYYPPLALLPVLASYILSAPWGYTGFLIAIRILMVICNCVTTLCVYYIGKKLYSEQVAITAALLSATSVSAVYFVLTRFDAFPTCIAMLAVLFVVNNNRAKGYLATILGLFAKLWPIILFPFLWLYNARDSSILEEGKKRAIWILLVGAGAFGLMMWAGYNQFMVYAGMVYCNTIPYVLDQYLKAVGIMVAFSVIATAFQVLTGIVILWALYTAHKERESLPTTLKMILLSIFVVIFFSQYRSPQYIMWMTPIVALLIADDIYGILAFYAVQILAFIEFPYAFRVLYVNANYLSPWALPFFTLLFVSYAILMWRALRKRDVVWVPDEIDDRTALAGPGGGKKKRKKRRH